MGKKRHLAFDKRALNIRRGVRLHLQSVILFDFLTNFNKSILPSIRNKLYHKTGWGSINSSLSNQLTILQDQIIDLTSSENANSINIINNTATILTDIILSIYNTLPEKTIKPNTSIPFAIQLLVKQKRKIERAFIKTRNPFLKTALNVISKKFKNKLKTIRPQIFKTELRAFS